MRRIEVFTAFSLWWLLSVFSFGQEIVDQWKYTLQRPGEGWRETDFDDAGWNVSSRQCGQSSREEWKKDRWST